MTIKEFSLAAPLSPAYKSFNLQPPRTPGRGTFPSLQVLTRPFSVILFTLFRQCTVPIEAAHLVPPQLVADAAIFTEKTPALYIAPTTTAIPTKKTTAIYLAEPSMGSSRRTSAPAIIVTTALI